MSARSITLLALGAAIGFAASNSNPAVSAQERAQLGALSISEGIYVDPKTFNIVKGASKTDPTAHMVKLGAQEVKAGSHHRSSRRQALPGGHRSGRRQELLVLWLGGGSVFRCWPTVSVRASSVWRGQ